MKETLVYSNSNPVAGTISQTEELTSHSMEYIKNGLKVTEVPVTIKRKRKRRKNNKNAMQN